jgi:hypothetical protein
MFNNIQSRNNDQYLEGVPQPQKERTSSVDNIWQQLFGSSLKALQPDSDPTDIEVFYSLHLETICVAANGAPLRCARAYGVRKESFLCLPSPTAHIRSPQTGLDCFAPFGASAQEHSR